MSYLICVTCLFFLLLSLRLDKRVYNPLAIFNLWWGVTVFVSGLGLFGIYVPSGNTYLIMLVAILSFNFPALFMLKSKKNGERIEYNNLNESTAVKVIILLQLIAIIYLFKRSIIVFQMLLAGMNYSSIRYEYFYTEKIVAGYDTLINNWFITPTITFSMILVSLLILQKKYNKLLMIFTILNVGLFTFSSGSRSQILTFALAIVIAWMINQKQVKFSFTRKITIIIFISVIIALLIYITTARSETDNSTFSYILQTVILYFTAPFIYFEKLYPYAIQDNVLLFGGAFFGGIIDIFILFFRFIGMDINQMSSYIGKYNQLFIIVGNDSAYNAFPTMVYTFIYDFGYLGIILGPLMFGIISLVSYKKMISQNRIAYKGIYIMVAIVIYESLMKWIGSSANPWLVVLMFLIFDKISRKRNFRR